MSATVESAGVAVGASAGAATGAAGAGVGACAGVVLMFQLYPILDVSSMVQLCYRTFIFSRILCTKLPMIGAN